MICHPDFEISTDCAALETMFSYQFLWKFSDFSRKAMLLYDSQFIPRVITYSSFVFKDYHKWYILWYFPYFSHRYLCFGPLLYPLEQNDQFNIFCIPFICKNLQNLVHSSSWSVLWWFNLLLFLFVKKLHRNFPSADFLRWNCNILSFPLNRSNDVQTDRFCHFKTCRKFHCISPQF